MMISIDANGKFDPVVESIIKHVDTDIPILPVTRLEDYKFNEDLYKLDKYVLLDFSELGWDWDMSETQLHGVNTRTKYKHLFPGDEWEKFEDFISANPPALYLKRELLSKDATETIRPVNYPCWHQVPAAQTKEAFDNRPIECNMIWGLSHEYRKYVHGEIWQKAGEHGYVVCDNIHNLQLFLEKEENPRKWLTVNTPWYSRFEMQTILAITQLSKITISLAGAGRSCFRMAEACINSTMYLWQDDILYSYPWENGVNCIRSVQGAEISTIVENLNNNNHLYDIYISGVENCRRYFAPTYGKEYILKLINEYV